MTSAPSEKSFTRALIWALEQLSKKSPFNLPKLLDKIGKAPNFPRTQQPEIGHRVDTSREDIYLAPIEKGNSNTDSIGSTTEDTRSQRTEYLDLRFHFRQPLKDEIVKETAEKLHSLITHKEILAEDVGFLSKHTLSRMGEIANQVSLQKKYGSRWQLRTLKSRSTATASCHANALLTPATASYATTPLTRVEGSEVEAEPSSNNEPNLTDVDSMNTSRKLFHSNGKRKHTDAANGGNKRRKQPKR